MTARTTRRNTKTEAPADVDLSDDLDAIVIDDLDLDVPEADDDTPIDEVEDEAPVASNRKYFSHANCDHARKGDAGKAARAACRRAIRNYLAAEAEFLATEDTVTEDLDTDVAV